MQLQLNSVIPNGLGSSSESIALEAIYSYLLRRYRQDFYSTISINQIDEELEEFISKKGGNIHINIRFPNPSKIAPQNLSKENEARLNLIHEALVRISTKDKKFDVDKLNEIKELIIKHNFNFEFVVKSFLNRKTHSIAELSVVPSIINFKYYVSIKHEDVLKCKQLIYNSLPGTPIDSILNYAKWRNNNEVVFWGKDKEGEIIIDSSKCEVKFVNLTKYKNSPLLEMFRFDTTEENRDLAHKNWLDSLPKDSLVRDFYDGRNKTDV